jgi:hypothetical protein
MLPRGRLVLPGWERWRNLLGVILKKRGQHVVEPAIGMMFDSLGEAYDFYNLYSWEHGFGVRYGKNGLNPAKTKTMQEIVCGRLVSSVCISEFFYCDEGSIQDIRNKIFYVKLVDGGEMFEC